MEATLANLLADIRNLTWVFIVLGALFTGLIAFFFTISRDVQKLESEIKEMKHTVEESSR